MKQEDKKLLLKDLCARLPYNIRVEYKGKCYVVLGIAHERLILLPSPFSSIVHNESPLVKEVKPYLFPLSSMTKEQKIQLLKISGIGSCIIHKDNITFCSNIDLCALKSIFNFLDKNYLDYRGLIKKGLAKDVTGLNIY